MRGGPGYRAAEGKRVSSCRGVRRYRRRSLALLHTLVKGGSLDGEVAWDWYLTAVNCILSRQLETVGLNLSRFHP